MYIAKRFQGTLFWSESSVTLSRQLWRVPSSENCNLTWRECVGPSRPGTGRQAQRQGRQTGQTVGAAGRCTSTPTVRTCAVCSALKIINSTVKGTVSRITV